MVESRWKPAGSNLTDAVLTVVLFTGLGPIVGALAVMLSLLVYAVFYAGDHGQLPDLIMAGKFVPFFLMFVVPSSFIFGGRQALVCGLGTALANLAVRSPLTQALVAPVLGAASSAAVGRWVGAAPYALGPPHAGSFSDMGLCAVAALGCALVRHRWTRNVDQAEGPVAAWKRPCIRAMSGLGLAPVGRWIGAPAVIGSAVLAVYVAGWAGHAYRALGWDRYQRVTAHLTYKGRSVSLDWVVDCRTVRRDDVAVDSTGVSPVLYGVPMPDGGMVAAVVPTRCGRNGTAPEAIPVFLTGHRVGDPDDLTAYLSEDAYKAPGADLVLDDVRVTPISLARRWLLSGQLAPNAVPQPAGPLARSHRTIGCHAFGRMPVPVDVRPMLARARPPGTGRYWVPPDDLLRDVIGKTYSSIAHSRLPFHALEDVGKNGTLRRGMTDWGGVSAPASRPRDDPPILDAVPIEARQPAGTTDLAGVPTPGATSWVAAAEVGMASCGSTPDLHPEPGRAITYTFPDGSTVATSSPYILDGSDVLYDRIDFWLA